jgi:hypothetical protein
VQASSANIEFKEGLKGTNATEAELNEKPYKGKLRIGVYDGKDHWY